MELRRKSGRIQADGSGNPNEFTNNEFASVGAILHSAPWFVLMTKPRDMLKTWMWLAAIKPVFLVMYQDHGRLCSFLSLLRCRPSREWRDALFHQGLVRFVDRVLGLPLSVHKEGDSLIVISCA